MGTPNSPPPLSSRADDYSDESAASDVEWVTRCCIRLLALNPDLTAEEALDFAQDLSVGKAMRALSPEWVAEDLYSAKVQSQAGAG